MTRSLPGQPPLEVLVGPIAIGRLGTLAELLHGEDDRAGRARVVQQSDEQFDGDAGVLGRTEPERGFGIHQSGAQPKRSVQWQAHEGAVTELAFTPDGSRIVSIGYTDFYLRMWDRSTGRLVAEEKLPDRPTGMAMFPDGERVAVVDVHGNVSLWPISLDHFGKPVRLRGAAGRNPVRVAVAETKLRVDGSTILELAAGKVPAAEQTDFKIPKLAQALSAGAARRAAEGRGFQTSTRWLLASAA